MNDTLEDALHRIQNICNQQLALKDGELTKELAGVLCNIIDRADHGIRSIHSNQARQVGAK